MKRSACLAALLLSSSTVALSAETATAKVTLSGGANAGSHQAATERGGCSTGLTGANSFGVQISNPKDKDPKKLNSVQLDLRDKSKPNQFVVTVGFGPLIGRTASYTIDTRAGKKGNGAITITESGSTATVKFSGTTADGVKLEGTIDCKTMLKAGR
jgi:hypothetical protein